MNGKGNIAYTYNAVGNKCKKVTSDSASHHSTTTLYLDGFVYQQADSINNAGGGTDTLQFMGLEEGRARWGFHKYKMGGSAYAWEYDFFEKDHLGDTRVVLSQEKDTAQYVATMESAYRSTENALFYNMTAYPRASASGYPVDLTVTNPNDSVVRLNGSGQKVGPAIILKVMSGDKVDLGVSYFYNNTGATNGQSLSVSDLINSLASGIVSLSGTSHGTFSALTGGSSPLNGAINSYLTNHNPNTSGKPNAYLNWILFDNQFNYVTGNALQVANYGTQTGGTLQSPLAQTGIQMSKSGYLYIYVSNATPGWDVFFDNLSVTTYIGPMLEENHYYPFGLTMAGISDKAIKSNYAENKYRFQKQELQNKEFSDGSGLELYEFKYRFEDDQTGRFWSIDPLASEYEYNSPYAFSEDKVTSHVELEGLEARSIAAEVNILMSGDATMGPGEAIVAALNPVGAWHGMVKAWNAIFPSAPTETPHPLTPSAPTATTTTGAPSAPTEANPASASHQQTASGQKSGSYTNTHQSGKRYHGKGTEARAAESAKRIAKEHADPLAHTEHTEAQNGREGFKQESERLKNDGGHKNPDNYNQRDSPGTKYRQQDGH